MTEVPRIEGHARDVYEYSTYLPPGGHARLQRTARQFA